MRGDGTDSMEGRMFWVDQDAWCPVCGDGDTEDGDIGFFPAGVRRERRCRTCGSTWVGHYRVVSAVVTHDAIHWSRMERADGRL